MGHLIRKAELLNRRRGITATDNGNCTALGNCLCDSNCTVAKFAHSETPIGPFQTTVPAPRMASAKKDPVSSVQYQGPSSRPGSDRTARPDARRPPHNGPQQRCPAGSKIDALGLCLRHHILGKLHLIILAQGRTDGIPQSFQERVRHPAADHQSIDLIKQVADNTDLVRHLCAAENCNKGTLRVSGAPPITEISFWIRKPQTAGER